MIATIRSPIKHINKPKNVGYYPVCEGQTIFFETAAWLRDNYLCVRCESIPRQRALIKTLKERFPNYRSLAIHESSPRGPASAKLQQNCRGHLPTQFFPEQKSGTIYNGFRCENLEQMTFVEIARTLKPGGAHVDFQ